MRLYWWEWPWYKEWAERQWHNHVVVGQVKGELETRDVRMQGYLSQVKHLQSGNQGMNLSDYCISLKVETHMLIP